MITFVSLQINHGEGRDLRGVFAAGGAVPEPTRGPRIIVNPNDILSIQEGGRWEIDPNDRNATIFVTQQNTAVICMRNGHQWTVEGDFDLLSDTLESISKLKG